MASGIFIVGALLARFVIGESIERKGPKRVLWAGIGFFLVASVLNVFAISNFFLLLVFRLFQGLGYDLALTATGTIVAHILPKESSDEGMSYFTMFVTLGSAIGPYMGTLAYVNDSIFYNLIVGIVLAFGIATCICTFLVQGLTTLFSPGAIRPFWGRCPIAFIGMITCFAAGGENYLVAVVSLLVGIVTSTLMAQSGKLVAKIVGLDKEAE